MVFRGTLADVNYAISCITYTPDDNWTGIDLLKIRVEDFGSGGLGGNQTDWETFRIHVGY